MIEPPRGKKRFGQHFLVDQSIINAIIRRFGAGAGTPVIEIGPGAGALTGPLLDAGVELTAVEIDRDMQAILLECFGDRANFTLAAEDILTVDFASLTAGRIVRVIGNLPYNITSPIIFRLIDNLPRIGDMYFMVQKEVAERIAAAPGSRDYGKPSVMVQRLCETGIDLAIPPIAFRPPPRVMSAMLRLRPRAAPLGGDVDAALFERVVSAAFAQRRKTLRNALKQVAPVEALADADIDPGRRAETVSVEEYARLVRRLSETFS